MASVSIRSVKSTDLPDLSEFEAAQDAPAYNAVGLAELIRQWRCYPAGSLLISANGKPQGALLSARIADAAALATTDAASVVDLHRDGGGEWVILSVLQRHGSQAQLREQLLKYALQLACATDGVRSVVVPLRAPPARTSSLPSQQPSAALLRGASHKSGPTSSAYARSPGAASAAA